MDLPRTAAGVAGLSAITLGVVTLTGPTVPDENWGARGAIVNALGLLTFAALVVAVELVPTLVPLSRGGIIGVRIAQVGLVLMVLESVASQVHGGNTLGPIFMVGLLLTLLGFLVSGIDGLLRRGARRLALVPFAALVIAIGAGDHGGFLLLGLVWCGLAVGAPARRDLGDVRARDTDLTHHA